MKRPFAKSLIILLLLSVNASLFSIKNDAESVKKIILQVNQKWQSSHTNPGNAFWDNAAYHIGNLQAYKATGNKEQLNYTINWAEKNKWMGAQSSDKSNWKYKYGESSEYVLFGDWQVCFQSYLELFEIQPDSQRINRALEVMDYQINTSNKDYWWWVDGLYMVMPVMTKMYKLTGDDKYLQKLYEYYQHAESVMLDAETGLFFRDVKYIYPKHTTKSGKKDFWARGNGWLFAGLARIIPELPLDWKYRNYFIQQYLTMAETLVGSQQKEGYWTRSILDPAFAPGPETSGTAFFTYGYLWGINQGLLTDKKFDKVAMKGWKYLSTKALQPDGTIGYVQPIGEKAIPGQVVNAASTANFGVGAFLLASSEMYKYAVKKSGKTPDYKGYLFAYFTGNRKSEEQIRFALSYDGLNFKALNNNEPIVSSEKISLSGGVRDPHILRGEDGKFYLVVTDMVSAKGWSSNRGMILMKSDNLTDWTSSAIHIPSAYPKEFGDVQRVWAPQTIYDPQAKKYLVYFSMLKGDGKDYDKVYYAYANKDFTALEGVPQVYFFNPNHTATIDADIIFDGEKYNMFFKTEGGEKGIKKAVAKTLTSGWEFIDKTYQQTKNAVEGSGVFQLNNSHQWVLMYDVYMNGRYEFCRSTDLENFSLIKEPINMDFHPRHGTIIPVTQKEIDALLKKWPLNNPALKGYYADPDIIYSNVTKKYHLYPTSDGFDGWSGKYFESFSSKDMKTWKNDGKILTLGTDVKWADRNAWAPCIIEKKIDGKYKYFYYFTAAQKIGVAVADHPSGPFKDSGKALVDKKPEGVRGGQNIDPDVFQDPVTGKCYLYWGNGFIAVGELNDDMISFKEGSVQVIKHHNSFREGTHVFYRNGQYYFTWSIDDTRSPNYSVGYATSTSPLGPINVPENYVVLQKDPSKGIFGTGHHTTIQKPGTDEWYMVYHRFNHPRGIKMGDAAGYNREVCIDPMTFNEDGSIVPVKPTHQGVK